MVPGFLVERRPPADKRRASLKRFPGSSNPPRRLVGHYGANTLEQARATARRWLELLQTGNDPATEVVGAPALPSGLGRPSPNPAASVSRVAYRLARPGRVALRVYNVQGQLVRDLVDAAAPAGEYSATWDGRDRSGAKVGPGVYFFRLESGADSWREKLILLR